MHMDGYLAKFKYDVWKTDLRLPGQLLKGIESEFLVDNDCVTLKGFSNNHPPPLFKTDLEKCEWEYNETHFHSDMFIEIPSNEIEYLQIAIESGKRLATRLRSIFKEQNFRVIISFYETEKINDEVEIYGSSTVRFYQIRPGCEEIMRCQDLNDFAQDAVMEIE